MRILRLKSDLLYEICCYNFYHLLVNIIYIVISISIESHEDSEVDQRKKHVASLRYPRQICAKNLWISKLAQSRIANDPLSNSSLASDHCDLTN